jgi:hypothetical protein
MNGIYSRNSWMPEIHLNKLIIPLENSAGFSFFLVLKLPFRFEFRRLVKDIPSLWDGFCSYLMKLLHTDSLASLNGRNSFYEDPQLKTRLSDQ